MPVDLYPLRFEPQFKSMLWGGQRLRPLLRRPASGDPTGEAWLLSDVPGSESRVSTGPLAGRTLRELMADYGEDFLGTGPPADGRFPLLFKLIDARQQLSVQVHPNDDQARALGEVCGGKTEAWVILESNPDTSRIYAGFRQGVTPERLRRALAENTIAETLHSFTPRADDCVFLPAGTIHAIGCDVVVFEVQQTSDVTYRFYDWNRVDARSGQPRELHVEQALACVDFTRGPCNPLQPQRDGERETLVACGYFSLARHTLRRPAPIGERDQLRVVVCISGSGRLDGEPIEPGDAVLYSACLPPASAVPDRELVLLECGLPPGPPC